VIAGAVRRPLLFAVDAAAALQERVTRPPEQAMTTKRITFPALFVILAALLAGCASTPPKAEWDGLVRQPGTRLDAVFLLPGAETELAAVRSVMIDPVSVSFARDFDPNRGTRSLARRVSADDLVAIQEGLADLFREVFSEVLAAGGYEVVTAPGPDTLRVTAGIVDLFINAPDTAMGATRTYTANTGRMTLVMELRDSVSGELLARAVDSRTGRGGEFWTINNRVTNTAEARRAIRTWAEALRRGLDEVARRAG
jgi:hypothetical protein